MSQARGGCSIPRQVRGCGKVRGCSDAHLALGREHSGRATLTLPCYTPLLASPLTCRAPLLATPPYLALGREHSGGTPFELELLPRQPAAHEVAEAVDEATHVIALARRPPLLLRDARKERRARRRAELDGGGGRRRRARRRARRRRLRAPVDGGGGGGRRAQPEVDEMNARGLARVRVRVGVGIRVWPPSAPLGLGFGHPS